MQDLISDLFVDNPNLEDRLAEFFNQNPTYLQAQQELLDLERQLMERMPRELHPLFLRYEQMINKVHSIYENGYYLFGLGLRRDLRESLWSGLL